MKFEELSLKQQNELNILAAKVPFGYEECLLYYLKYGNKLAYKLLTLKSIGCDSHSLELIGEVELKKRSKEEQ